MGTAVIGTIVLGIFVLVGYSTYKNGEKEGCCGGDYSPKKVRYPERTPHTFSCANPQNAYSFISNESVSNAKSASYFPGCAGIIFPRAPVNKY